MGFLTGFTKPAAKKTYYGRAGGKSDFQRSMKGFIMAGLSFKKLFEGDTEIWTEPRKSIVGQMVRSFLQDQLQFFK